MPKNTQTSKRVFNRFEIRRRRKARNLTMQQAGEIAGFPTYQKQRWYDVESGLRGEFTPETLEAVARALRCRIDALFTSPEQLAADESGQSAAEPMTSSMANEAASGVVNDCQAPSPRCTS